MISEDQHDQAALFALDLLSAEEASAFERTLAANPELQALVRELRDAAGSLALTAPQNKAPSAALKARVMEKIAAENGQVELPNVIRPSASVFSKWIPWAIAAGLMIFCGVLVVDRAQLRELADERDERAASPPVLVALAATDDGPQKAQAVVVWEPAKQVGTIKITNLPAAEAGKDYQLWAVDAAHKDPISAGIVRVNSDGIAQVQFKPTEAARQVKAFAISIEREGGVPKKEGPILLVGSA